MTSIYLLPQDDLIVKPLVNLEYPYCFGVKGVGTAQHLCVFVGSWSGNLSSTDSLCFMGYACVYCKLFFSWSRCMFDVAMCYCLCDNIVVDSITVHPRKLTFKIPSGTVVKVGLK